MHQLQEAKGLIDGSLGATAATAPWWLQDVQSWIGFIMALGGLVLLALRIAIAWREWRQGKSK